MDTILTVSVAVIAVCMVVMVAITVAALLRVRVAAMKATELFGAIHLQLAPVLHDATAISADVRKVVQHIESAARKVDTGADALRAAAQDVKDFEQRLRERIEEPIGETVSFIAGLLRGGQAFWRMFGRKND